jgi:hypothetical protein
VKNQRRWSASADAIRANAARSWSAAMRSRFFGRRTMPCWELKTARLTVLIDAAQRQAFKSSCARQDATPSQVERHLIHDHFAHHGIKLVPSGLDHDSERTRAR